MTASSGRFTCTKHVRGIWEPFRLVRFDEAICKRSCLAGFNVQWAIPSVCIGIMREPVFGSERFCLCQSELGPVECKIPVYLSHGPKHFFAIPLGKAPIIIVLLDSSHADRAIGPATPTQKPSSRNMDRPITKTWLWRRDEIPIGNTLMVLGPTIYCS